jgi:Pyruvate/2-oxoacid:ferredoxin oxidoreductase gamma subunit
MFQAHHFTYTELKTHKGENMPNSTKLIINCETKEQIEVELTDEEVAQLDADRAKAEADRAEREAAEAAKAEAKASAQAKLAALGLTEDEINALIK